MPLPRRIGTKSLLGILILMPMAPCLGQEKHPNETAIENDILKVRLIPRTPDQMAAFYIGRGFPKNAVDETRKYCFITISIRNKSEKIVWLELNQWRFGSKDKTIKRYDASYWKNQWDKLKLPKANRATFRWTSLPESRDLHPYEPVGGNVTLVPNKKKFTIRAHFKTDADKRGKPLTLEIPNMACIEKGP